MLKQKPNSDSSKLETSDKKNIKQIKQLLSSAKSLPRLVSSTGEEVVLAESVYNTLYKVLEAMESGVETEITISLVDRDMTVKEVAEVLNVSEPYLEKLLNRGEISYSTVGDVKFLNRRDVLNYKNDRNCKRREDLSNFTAFLQEAGCYTD